MGSGPPDEARVVHRGANKLLVQQNSIPDGEFTTPVEEGTQQSHPLGSSPANMADVRRPGEPFVQSYSQLTSCIDPLDWHPKRVTGRG
jgi:hypothetical protein